MLAGKGFVKFFLPFTDKIDNDSDFTAKLSFYLVKK